MAPGVEVVLFGAMVLVFLRGLVEREVVRTRSLSSAFGLDSKNLRREAPGRSSTVWKSWSMLVVGGGVWLLCGEVLMIVVDR